MLTASPHLQVRRPSPTTAEFTVTTCPAATLSNRLLLGVLFLLRALLALSALLLLHSTWTLPPFQDDAAPAGLAPTITITSSVHRPGDDTGLALAPPSTPAPAWLPYALARVARTRPGAALTLVAAALPRSLLVPLGAALLYLATLRIHTTESLLVLRGLGIQTSSTGGSYLQSWRPGTRFIPTEKIRDVLINEAFRGFAVRYYLVVVVDGEEDVVVVFPRLLPGRGIVERVWRGVRGCLWEPPEGSGVVVRRAEEKGGYG